MFRVADLTGEAYVTAFSEQVRTTLTQETREEQGQHLVGTSAMVAASRRTGKVVHEKSHRRSLNQARVHCGSGRTCSDISTAVCSFSTAHAAACAILPGLLLQAETLLGCSAGEAAMKQQNDPAAFNRYGRTSTPWMAYM
jgi:hypothetical protein